MKSVGYASYAKSFGVFSTTSPYGLFKCEYAVNSQRPVNLDLRTIKLPITAYASILHRISGVILFFGLVILMCFLDKSLSSPTGFAEAKETLANPFVKFIVWGLVSSLLYHLIAGIPHLITDAGIGGSLEAAKLTAKVVLILSAVITLVIGVWIW